MNRRTLLLGFAAATSTAALTGVSLAGGHGRIGTSKVLTITFHLVVPNWSKKAMAVLLN